MNVQVVADLFDALSVSPQAPGETDPWIPLELTEDERRALASLAARAGVQETTVWHAAWALLLAHLAGAEAARVQLRAAARVLAVPAQGSLEDWLRGIERGGSSPAMPAAATDVTTDVTTDAATALPGSAWADEPPAALGDDDVAMCWSVTSGGAKARFAPAKLDRANAQRLAQLLRVVLTSMLAPAADLVSASPLGEDERELVLGRWNQTAVHYRPEATVHGLFREQAAAAPDRPALLWDGGRLSYRELDAASDALAEKLIAAGVTADQPVALVIERCPEAVIAALAILKAGGAYLPLDPDYP
ncbi:MAG TPA: AMP-binding protein, partial [Kofleriaceae bacterium]|nr:AMP-binding protein [Kofleriaceae bacterium]